MLLTGNPIVEKLTPETKKRLIDHKKSDGHVALFLLSDDKSSEVYI